MGTAYTELYASAYSKIKDYDFVKIGEEEANAILKEYIRPAILMFECCHQDLFDRNDEEEAFNFELTDVNFEILSNFMVVCYLDATYIRTPLALSAHMSTTDFHKFDNSNVLGNVIKVRDMYKKENTQLMINYSLRGRSRLGKLYMDNQYTANKRKRGRKGKI